MTVTHTTQHAGGVDAGDGTISKTAWNEAHTGTNDHGHTATGDGGLISLSGPLIVTPFISPTQLAANTDDWNPTSLSTAAVIRASTDASRNLTGIAGGAAGRVILLCNVGGFDLVLKHDATSTTGNRFYGAGSADRTMTPNTSVWLVYDATSSRWRIVG